MFLLATGNGDEGNKHGEGDQNADELFQDLSPFTGASGEFQTTEHSNC
jgi:hypothetical protein